MINEPANFCDEAHREHIISKLQAENKRLREALMKAYTHCLVGSVISDVDGNLFPITHYEKWHDEVRAIMHKALSYETPDVPKQTGDTE